MRRRPVIPAGEPEGRSNLQVRYVLRRLHCPPELSSDFASRDIDLVLLPGDSRLETVDSRVIAYPRSSGDNIQRVVVLVHDRLIRIDGVSQRIDPLTDFLFVIVRCTVPENDSGNLPPWHR